MIRLAILNSVQSAFCICRALLCRNNHAKTKGRQVRPFSSITYAHSFAEIKWNGVCLFQQNPMGNTALGQSPFPLLPLQIEVQKINSLARTMAKVHPNTVTTGFVLIHVAVCYFWISLWLKLLVLKHLTFLFVREPLGWQKLGER